MAQTIALRKMYAIDEATSLDDTICIGKQRRKRGKPWERRNAELTMRWQRDHPALLKTHQKSCTCTKSNHPQTRADNRL